MERVVEARGPEQQREIYFGEKYVLTPRVIPDTSALLAGLASPKGPVT